ncbi:MAG: transposase [Lysobacterales bacterium]
MASPRLLHGRQSQVGLWYVITTVSLGRIPVFASAQAAQLVAEEIRRVPQNFAESHAWVVMPDHLHWMIELRSGIDLSRLVQGLKSRSAIAVNRSRGQSGPIWQPGFYDHQLRADEDFRAQARYIVANPLRRGLVARIEDYPHLWCRWIAGMADLD